MPTTTRGRVVYGRKPHLFTYRDVLRIVRKVEVSGDEANRVQELGFALAAILAAISDMVAAIRRLIPEKRAFWVTRTILMILVELYQLASFLPERVTRGLQFLINSVRRIST